MGGARAKCKRRRRCLRAAAAADERGRGGAWSAGDGVHRRRQGVAAALGGMRRRLDSGAGRQRREGRKERETEYAGERDI